MAGLHSKYLKSCAAIFLLQELGKGPIHHPCLPLTLPVLLHLLDHIVRVRAFWTYCRAAFCSKPTQNQHLFGSLSKQARVTHPNEKGMCCLQNQKRPTRPSCLPFNCRRSDATAYHSPQKGYLKMPHITRPIEISQKLKAPELLPDLFPISRCVNVLELSLVVATSCSVKCDQCGINVVSCERER